MYDKKVAVDAAPREASSRILRTLVWAVPTFLLAAGGLARLAVKVPGGERLL